jgi:geranylgeranyl diphosphate synthase type I
MVTDSLASAQKSNIINTPIETWSTQLRNNVESYLSHFFSEKKKEIATLSPHSIEMVEAIEELSMRGGKRLRPLLIGASYICASDLVEQSVERCAPASAAIELLQSYLLIHDDWMDQDDIRRGGPSTHAFFRERYPQTQADSVAILCGDMAAAYSWELFLKQKVSRPQRWIECILEMHQAVYCGQHLDVTLNNDVKKMHYLKTSSYSVLAPLKIGALLAEADVETLTNLMAWGEPIGEAFQIKDDLLSTFGKRHETGKPSDDMLHGKKNSVYEAAFEVLQGKELQSFQQAWGNPKMSVEDGEKALSLLITNQIPLRLEEKMEQLTQQAHRVLEQSSFYPQGKKILSWLANLITSRKG